MEQSKLQRPAHRSFPDVEGTDSKCDHFVDSHAAKQCSKSCQDHCVGYFQAFKQKHGEAFSAELSQRAQQMLPSCFWFLVLEGIWYWKADTLLI